MRLNAIAALTLAALLSSCGTLPRINCTDAHRVYIGMEQKQAVALLGDPYFVMLSRDATVYGWQDDEDYNRAKETLRVTFNPATGIIKKIEGSCAR